MRKPHPQSQVTHLPICHMTNQRRYISTFTRSMDSKLIRVVARTRIPHPACHVTLWSCCHVKTIQYVVYNSSTSSWSCILETDRFQMIMATLKTCSLHKESFYGDVLLSSWMFTWKKYLDRLAGSVGGIIILCLRKACSISPD